MNESNAALTKPSQVSFPPDIKVLTTHIPTPTATPNATCIAISATSAAVPPDKIVKAIAPAISRILSHIENSNVKFHVS